MSSKSQTTIAGIVILVVVVAAVASLGYFQVYVAPSVFKNTSTTTTTASVSCTKTSCVNITIPLGAGTPSGAPGYSPDVVTIVIGVNNTVVWKNNDTSIHSVTARDNSFNDATMKTGDIFIYTFTKPGTYKYYCIYHFWMNGTVIVKQTSK
jgi:plastocyanin